MATSEELIQYLNYGAGTGLEPYLDGAVDEHKEQYSVLNLVYLGVDLEDDISLILDKVCNIEDIVNNMILDMAFLKKCCEEQIDLRKLIRLLIASVERTQKGRL
jgi:hypothetical protein